MLHPTCNQQMHCEDTPAARDICGGVLVLLIFLVPTFLAATYLGHVSHFLVEWVQMVTGPAILRGAGLC